MKEGQGHVQTALRGCGSAGWDGAYGHYGNKILEIEKESGRRRREVEDLGCSVVGTHLLFLFDGGSR
jgi:hypothetical protein